MICVSARNHTLGTLVSREIDGGLGVISDLAVLRRRFPIVRFQTDHETLVPFES